MIDEISRGEAAARIVNDEIFQDSKAKLFEQMGQLRRAVPIYETTMHTRLILMEQVAHQFFQNFEYTIQTGKIARIQREQEEARRTLRSQAVSLFGKIGRNSL